MAPINHNMNQEDLEYGKFTISKRFLKLLQVYKHNSKKIKTTLLSFVAISVAILVRFSFDNVENIKETVITLDEDPYEIFDINDEINTNVSKDLTVEFPRKTSLVNQRLQELNINAITNKVSKFLNESENLCIHLRHFGSVYDILVFQDNRTLINPEIVEMSTKKKNVKYIDLENVPKYKKLSSRVLLNYVDKNMNTKYNQELIGNDAFCFQFYY